jgi:NitT/TauT family transport system permease protein
VTVAPVRRAGQSPALLGLLGLVLFGLLLEVLPRIGVLPAAYFPPTSRIARALVEQLGRAAFWQAVLGTVVTWLIGLAVAVVAGILLGLVIGSIPALRAVTASTIEFLRPIPSVALILLVSLLLGPGLRMMATLIVYGAIWPVLYNTIAGIDDVDPLAKETNLAFGFSRLATIRMVSLPSAAPFIATGIRLASSVAIILDIGAGYITGRINGPGIGAFIADQSSGAGNLPVILAATVWAGILGLVLDRLLVAAEHRLLRWNHARLAEVA